MAKSSRVVEKAVINSLSSPDALSELFGNIKDYLYGNTGKKSNKYITTTLFISFDIVNSTRFKSFNSPGTFEVIKEVFNHLKNSMTQEIGDVYYWRTVGDEILFFVGIENEEDLQIIIPKIFSILKNMYGRLKDGSLFSSDSENYKLLLRNNYLSLKAAAWLAKVTKNPDSILYPTIVTEQPHYEFQGHDIDIGFRVSKAAARDRRFVISFELAYILSKHTDHLKHLHLVAEKKLKGVWDGRIYPIVWYHEGPPEFEDSFYYDETGTCDITKNYRSFIAEKDCDIHSYLEHVCNDQNLLYKIKDLRNYSQGENVFKQLKGSSSLEIHCQAVCVTDDKKVLMLQQSEQHSFPDCWEFGCFPALNSHTFEEMLSREFKKCFNIDIEVLTPFRAYSFEDEDGIKINGIRFKASIKNADNLKINRRATEKYKDFKLVSISELSRWSKNKFIDGKKSEFLDIAKVAINGQSAKN